jgi:hypothetical protein
MDRLQAYIYLLKIYNEIINHFLINRKKKKKKKRNPREGREHGKKTGRKSIKYTALRLRDLGLNPEEGRDPRAGAGPEPERKWPPC